MKLSLSLLVVPLLASPWAAAAIDSRETGCNANNCLRALRNPTRAAAATSFCRSYTAANVVATTSLPDQFATPCGSGPTQSLRLSSACSCYVPPPGPSPPACNNTISDSKNCGTCGNVCPTGNTCRSGACVPPVVPGNCTSYTASCSDVINGVLASNSIASPQLVDYRIQSALLGLTTPSDFLAALGSDPCQMYTDPTENQSCRDLVANSQFIAQLTSITNEVLSSLQTCASDFATGGSDAQLIINDPTCAAGRNSVRRHEKRSSFGAGEDLDLTRRMLQGIEFHRSLEGVPSLGPAKSSDLIQLSSRQLSSCSRTGTCFEICPDCRNQQTYCGTTATIITTTVCTALAAIANAAAATLAGAACATACGPAAPLCAGFCGRAAGGLSAVAVGAACAVLRTAICNPLAEKCANCNSEKNGICDADSTQCCAGETGTQCGQGCCCCPQCQAPGGINCACTAAPC